jgi:hypothetical protein
MDFETEQRILDLEQMVRHLSERLTEVESELRGAQEWLAQLRDDGVPLG